MTKEQRAEIAQTIIQQLGGRRFSVMTGAHTFIALESGLQFKLPRGAKNKANLVRITLTPLDLYTVEFIKYRNLEQKVISTHEMVYFDQLQELFTEQTGLDTHL